MTKQEATPYFSPDKPPREAYTRLVAEGLIAYDEAQQATVDVLETLYNQLLKREDTHFWPFGKKKKQVIKSVYIWGDVGRGKSMLMDLFYDTLINTTKRRVHFHRFMQEVHGRLHTLRQDGENGHMEQLIEEICEAQQVLCFDELQATDVTDASLITRIFEGLMAAGVVVVATSNRVPEDLYQGEVQKERFETLTALIGEHFHILNLDGQVDHRREQVQAMQSVYFTPLGVNTDIAIQDTLAHLSPSNHQEVMCLEVNGRELEIKTYGEKVALASFDELCGQALGAADYLAIAEAFEVVVLTDIPLLSPDNRNEAKRFVTLIDALYEHHVLFICSAAAEPDQLYETGHGSFEFERTVSRLMEMQSADYLMEAAS